MENKREILKVVDLQKKFHKLEVLKGISTTFHENEVVSIIGHRPLPSADGRGIPAVLAVEQHGRDAQPHRCPGAH